MNHIFIGSFYPREKSEEIQKNSKKGLDNASDNFQWSLITGLENFFPIKAVTTPAIRSYPLGYKKIKIDKFSFESSESFKGYLAGFLNLPLIKHISKTISLKNRLKKDIIRGDEVIFIYSIHSPFLNVAYNLKRLNKGIKVCLIVPDLPQYMSGSQNIIYRFLKKIDSLLIKKYLSSVDFFVLLTGQMAKPLEIGDRPHVIVEGIFNEKPVSIDRSNTRINKTILYTGTLDKRYGILNLLEAFHNIKSKDYELWICGAGDAEQMVKDFVAKDERILFFGFLSYHEVIKLQKEATVLINPRTSEGEFTKYSFPSKVMEYLGSGIPTIMHKLEGIPDEYYDYCYVAEEQNSNGLRDTILDVCEKSQDELEEFGRRARKFVVEHKNPKKQVEKIVSMVESNLNQNYKF